MSGTTRSHDNNSKKSSNGNYLLGDVHTMSMSQEDNQG